MKFVYKKLSRKIDMQVYLLLPIEEDSQEECQEYHRQLKTFHFHRLDQQLLHSSKESQRTKDLLVDRCLASFIGNSAGSSSGLMKRLLLGGSSIGVSGADIEPSLPFLALITGGAGR